MAMLGLRFCARAFSSCGKRGPLFIAVRRPLTIAASLVAERRLQTRRLSSCGSRAQLLRGMWDLPRPGLEPVSPALAGRFSTTAPPGKPQGLLSCSLLSLTVWSNHQKPSRTFHLLSSSNITLIKAFRFVLSILQEPVNPQPHNTRISFMDKLEHSFYITVRSNSSTFMKR